MIHLLTIKKLTLHFTNPLVNVALKLLKVETQRKSPEFAPALDKIRRNLGEKKYLLRDIAWCIHAFLTSYKPERTISHSKLTTRKHPNEEKI